MSSFIATVISAATIAATTIARKERKRVFVGRKEKRYITGTCETSSATASFLPSFFSSIRIAFTFSKKHITKERMNKIMKGEYPYAEAAIDFTN
tara:strand:- start:995 stop:1276 length:282 start_codon:yes stop_codon:yes gene_type:complete